MAVRDCRKHLAAFFNLIRLFFQVSKADGADGPAASVSEESPLIDLLALTLTANLAAELRPLLSPEIGLLDFRLYQP